MRRMTRTLATILLLGFGGSASALGLVAGDCDSLRTQAQLIERSPAVGAACESIVSVEGRRYLIMGAELRQLQEEQLVLRFRGSDEDVVLSPGAEPSIAAHAGRSLPPSTAVGSALRVYVPEDRVLEVFAAATDPGAPAVPVAVEPVESRAARDARIANYTCCPRRRPWYPIIDVLPQTATPLPLIGMLGLGLLAVAAGLARCRHRRD